MSVAHVGTDRVKPGPTKSKLASYSTAHVTIALSVQCYKTVMYNSNLMERRKAFSTHPLLSRQLPLT